MIWRSVVGKLWATILFLVAFILVVLMILLSQFFENHFVTVYERSLHDDLIRLRTVLVSNSEQQEEIEKFAWQLVNPLTRVVIVEEDGRAVYSPNSQNLKEIPVSFFSKHESLKRVLADKET
ncbi:MAG: PAS domain-containing sensor histidine kinase, partial [Bacilli bacterium]